jgi:hypothetical protein
MQYTVDYFIKKFEAIPEDKITGSIWWSAESNCGCAHGHCGVRYEKGETEESRGLLVFLPLASAITVGTHSRYQQPTPKQRILAALYDIKKMQQPVEEPKVKEIIRYVAVPETISESIPETIFN